MFEASLMLFFFSLMGSWFLILTNFRLDVGRFYRGAVKQKRQFLMINLYVKCLGYIFYVQIEFLKILMLIQVLCSSWKDDGTTVFSAGCDKQVKMWPLLSGGQPVTVAMHDAPIKEVAWIQQMNLLVTGSWDKTLKYGFFHSFQHLHLNAMFFLISGDLVFATE